MHFIMFIWYLWEKKPNTICACSRQEFKIKFYRTECQHLPFTHNYFFLRNRIPLNSFKIQTAKTSEGMWLFTNLTGLCLISYNFVMGHVLSVYRIGKMCKKRTYKISIVKIHDHFKKSNTWIRRCEPFTPAGWCVCVYITPNWSHCFINDTNQFHFLFL